MTADPLFDLPELPELPAETAKATERDLLEALHQRYGQVMNQIRGDPMSGSRRYVVAEHVRSRTDIFGRVRTADFIACAAWWSDKYAIHGHEIKVSRSDWLRELKDPDKAGAFIPYVHYWWLVVPDKAIVRDGELPEGWGLLAPRGSVLAAASHAPRRNAVPLTPSQFAALLRAVAKTAATRALDGAA